MAEPERNDGIVWFDPFSWFFAFVGALSFSHLVSQAYSIGLGPVLVGLLDVYEAELTRIAVVFEPAISWLLWVLRSVFSWELTLYPHWKHVFVLLNVYFAARYTSAFRAGNWGAAWLMVLSGVAFGALASVGAGTTPLTGDTAQIQTNIAAMTLYPALGILVFDFVEIIWTSLVRVGVEGANPAAAFRKLLGRIGVRFGAAVAIAGLAIILSLLPVGFDGLPSPGLSLLLAITLLMGFYWLYQGVITVPGRRRPDESWVHAFLRMGSTRVGWAIVRYMALGTATVVVGWWMWDKHGLG